MSKNFSISEIMRRRRQAEATRAGSDKVRHEMLQKTAQDGYRMVREYCTKKIEEVVPAWWRRLAVIVVPDVWFQWWIGVQRFLVGLVKWTMIRPAQFTRKMIWKGGAYSEVESAGEWTVRISIYRGFRLRDRCMMDWRTGKVTEVEHG